VRDLNQGKEQAMLSVDLPLFIVQETRFRIFGIQEGNVAEYNLA
jgi:hypothetical protein